MLKLSLFLILSAVTLKLFVLKIFIYVNISFFFSKTQLIISSD